MNIYRVFRLGALNELPAGAVLEAVVVAPDAGTARAVVAIEDSYELSRAWLSQHQTRVQEVGVTTDVHDDDRIDGDDEPYALMVSRQVSRGTEAGRA